LVVRWSAFDRVGHGHGVPDRADVIRVLAMVMTTIAVAVTVVDAIACSRCQRRPEWWSIAFRSDRGNAGTRTVDGVSPETG
jgi:phosphoketolase